MSCEEKIASLGRASRVLAALALFCGVRWHGWFPWRTHSKTKLAEGLTPKFAALLDPPMAGGGTVFEGMVMYLNRGFPFLAPLEPSPLLRRWENTAGGLRELAVRCCLY